MIYFHAKMKSLLYVLFLLLLPICVYAKGRLNPTKSTEKIFLIDRYGSPYVTSSWLISGRNFMSEIEDKWIRDKFLLRWSSLFLNNIYNDLSMLFAHEVSGHGFRERSFKNNITGYGLFFLFGGITTVVTPVNGLGGITHANSFYSLKDSLVDNEKSLITLIAGNEANTILANELILKNFKSGYLDYRHYNLFFKAFTNLLGYILITHHNDSNGDIQLYLGKMTNKYNLDIVRLSTLQYNTIIFFINPILYMSIWSFYAYLFKNEKIFLIPHLRWNHITYMPVVRVGLTPFGIGYYLDNFMSNQKQTFLISLYLGKSSFYTKFYGGIGCKTEELYTYRNYSLDLSTQVWYQPKLLLKKDNILKDKNYWGGLLGIYNKFKINPYFSINGALVYKTLGFVEGIETQSGLIWQAGLSLCL